MAAEDIRTVQIPSFPYLLIPTAALGLLAACGAPEPTEPADPTAPESAQLETLEILTAEAGPEAAQGSARLIANPVVARRLQKTTDGLLIGAGTAVAFKSN